MLSIVTMYGTAKYLDLQGISQGRWWLAKFRVVAGPRQDASLQPDERFCGSVITASALGMQWKARRRFSPEQVLVAS